MRHCRRNIDHGYTFHFTPLLDAGALSGKEERAGLCQVYGCGCRRDPGRLPREAYGGGGVEYYAGLWD